MPEVKIYTTRHCFFCHRAKALLDGKGATYEEIDVGPRHRREEMSRLAGGRSSVPQIFIDGEHIGGCDDLVALEIAGRLDARLHTGAASER